MIGRRTAVGLTLLCALILSAVMASSALAVPAGTTAFTCVKEPNPTKTTKGFLDEHCTKTETGTGVKFVHLAIKQDESTIFHGTNEHTSADTKTAEPAILQSTISKTTKVEISCKKVFAHGNLENNLIAGTEHIVHGTKITIKYTECVFVEPSTCKVKGGEILVENVTATTEKELEKNIKFKPEVGTTFVTILAENCFGIAKFPIEGTVRAQPSGATLTFSETGITGEKSLTFLKEPAGLSGKITVSKAKETQESGTTENPIALTPVET